MPTADPEVMTMAYLFFDDVLADAPSAGPRAAKPAGATPVAELTTLEWIVVALARIDRLSTLRRRGRFGIACGFLFGKRQNPALADSRLEALRRIAVLMWHDSSRVPNAEVEAFIAAGFTQGHHDRVVVWVASQLRRPTAGGHR